MSEETPKYDSINPNHYKRYSVEVIDMMIKIWGRDAVINYCEMNAFKYRMRMGTKPTADIKEDMEKEKWYLDMAKQLRDGYKHELIDPTLNIHVQPIHNK